MFFFTKRSFKTRLVNILSDGYCTLSSSAALSRTVVEFIGVSMSKLELGSEQTLCTNCQSSYISAIKHGFEG